MTTPWWGFSFQSPETASVGWVATINDFLIAPEGNVSWLQSPATNNAETQREAWEAKFLVDLGGGCMGFSSGTGLSG